MEKYLIYCKESNKSNAKQEESEELPDNYSLRIWTPSVFDIVPRGLPLIKFVGWWILYLVKSFYDSHYIYTIFLVYYKHKVIHYTVITSKSWKFNFMKSSDIQIGPSNTDFEHRRKGIGLYIIKKILEMKYKKNIRFWWVVREENMISRRFIEKAGFFQYGSTIRKQRFGIGYFINDPLQ